MIINTLFSFLSFLGSLALGTLILTFAFAVTGIVAGLAWEALAFYKFGNLYGFSRGFWSGALAGLAWSAYALTTSITLGAAFVSVLGLAVIALVALIAIKSYIGMQPVPIPDWA
jgi:hypothetical protein